MLWGLNLGRGKTFSSSQKLADWLAGSPSFLCNGHQGLFPW
jgi:hypothetical protein